VCGTDKRQPVLAHKLRQATRTRQRFGSSVRQDVLLAETADYHSASDMERSDPTYLLWHVILAVLEFVEMRSPSTQVMLFILKWFWAVSMELVD